MIRNIKIRNDLVKIILNNVSNVFTVTGAMGIDYTKEQRFYELAQRAALKNTIVTDKKIKWVPFWIDSKTPIVCGIKTTQDPTEEINLIEGLIAALKFEYFLKEQVDRFFDPKSRFIKSLLLTNEFTEFEQATEMGDILGVNLRSPQAVIIIEVPGFSKSIHDKNKALSPEQVAQKITEASQEVIKKVSENFSRYDQNIIGCLAPDRFVVLKWAGGKVNTLNSIKYYKEKAEFIRKIIEKKTGLVTTSSAGQYYSGLAGLRKSYHDAESALDLGKKIWGEGKSYHIADVGMYISLSETVSFERKNELAHQILGDVIRDKDLYKTMKTFFELNMNLTDAAKKLHLHRNTLIYRLEKIKKELGLDPRKFSDAVHIKLGLLLYSPVHKKCDISIERRSKDRRRRSNA